LLSLAFRLQVLLPLALLLVFQPALGLVLATLQLSRLLLLPEALPAEGVPALPQGFPLWEQLLGLFLVLQRLLVRPWT
jgi:hypothetical protein